MKKMIISSCWFLVVATFLLLIGCQGYLGLLGTGEATAGMKHTPDDKSKSKPSSSTKTPKSKVSLNSSGKPISDETGTKVTAPNLKLAYNQGSKEYTGKEIIVSGTVSTLFVEKYTTGNTWIVLDFNDFLGSKGPMGVSCKLLNKNEKDVNFTKGHSISLRGKCKGFSPPIAVLVENCQVIVAKKKKKKTSTKKKKVTKNVVPSEAKQAINNQMNLIKNGNTSPLPNKLTQIQLNGLIAYIKEYNNFKLPEKLLSRIDSFVNDSLRNIKNYNSTTAKNFADQLAPFHSKGTDLIEIPKSTKNNLPFLLNYAFDELSKSLETKIKARYLMLVDLKTWIKTRSPSNENYIQQWLGNVKNTNPNIFMAGNNIAKQQEVSKKLISGISKLYGIDWNTVQ
jgi:hypothetical protein